MILREKFSAQEKTNIGKSSIEQGYECLFSLKRATLQIEINILLAKLQNIITSSSPEDLKWLVKKFIELDIDKKEVLEVFISTSNDEVAKIIAKNYKYFSDLELIRFCDKSPEKNLYKNLTTRSKISEFLVDYLLSKKDKSSMQSLLDNPNLKLTYESIREISEYIPSASLILSKFSDTEPKNIEDKKGKKTVYFFTNPNKSNASFSFSYEHNETIKNNRLINNLIQKKSLSSFYLVSSLGKGDIWSFIYGISVLADVPYKMAEDICTNSFMENEFTELLYSAKFSNSNIEVSRLLLKLISKVTITQSLDSLNFKFLISQELQYEIDVSENLHHIVQYLINLG